VDLICLEMGFTLINILKIPDKLVLIFKEDIIL